MRRHARHQPPPSQSSSSLHRGEGAASACYEQPDIESSNSSDHLLLGDLPMFDCSETSVSSATAASTTRWDQHHQHASATKTAHSKQHYLGGITEYYPAAEQQQAAVNAYDDGAVGFSNKRWLWIAVVCCCCCAAFFGLGVAVDRFWMLTAAAAGASQQQQRQLQDQIRDELLVSQEKLLVDMTKQQTQKQPPCPRDDSTENNNKFAQHLELLQQELAAQKQQLQQQETAVTAAQVEAKQAWAAYDLHVQQIAMEQAVVNQDLSKVFRHHVEKHFGSSQTLYVELQLQFPAAAEFRFITMEMASVHVMPTAVYYFLRQIEAGLWDGVAFRFNEPHILLTDPSEKLLPTTKQQQDMTTTTTTIQALLAAEKTSALDQMMAVGLGHLPYSESSESQPHVEYTVGYSAATGLNRQRPGPAFYINVADNTAVHQQEPCFATIIIGRDVVNEMHQQFHGPTKEDPYYIQNPVRIVSTRILSQLQQAVGGPEYVAQEQEASQKAEI